MTDRLLMVTMPEDNKPTSQELLLTERRYKARVANGTFKCDCDGPNHQGYGGHNSECALVIGYDETAAEVREELAEMEMNRCIKCEDGPAEVLVDVGMAFCAACYNKSL